jgi:hypothetical protein
MALYWLIAVLFSVLEERFEFSLLLFEEVLVMVVDEGVVLFVLKFMLLVVLMLFFVLNCFYY